MGEPEKPDSRTSFPSPSLRTKSGAASPGLSIATPAPRPVKGFRRVPPREGQTSSLERLEVGLGHGDLQLLLDDAVDGVHEMDLENRARGLEVALLDPRQQALAGLGQPLRRPLVVKDRVAPGGKVLDLADIVTLEAGMRQHQRVD